MGLRLISSRRCLSCAIPIVLCFDESNIGML